MGARARIHSPSSKGPRTQRGIWEDWSETLETVETVENEETLETVKNVKKLKKNKNKSFSEVLIQLGPSYIKLGQFLATRPDIIGGHFAIELSTLQDNLPTFPIDISKKIIEKKH